MKEKLPHISVCICTYRRPPLLRRLLDELREQKTANQFTYSIVVADNDDLQSAKPIVTEFARKVGPPVIYCVEPRQNISLTRNHAIANAHGDFIAFIDDDEFPTPSWLLTLFRACEQYKVDGALGPVKPYFEMQPPAWVVNGKFYERPYPTGFLRDWREGRTGNVLLKSGLFTTGQPAFNPALLTGEDQDFFAKMMEKGHTFVWCHEAVAYEVVPPARWELGFMLRRALLRGKVSLRHRGSKAVAIGKSILALPLYCVSLPFLLPFGYHLFIKYLIKIFDHAGRLLSVVGLNPAKETYVTE